MRKKLKSKTKSKKVAKRKVSKIIRRKRNPVEFNKDNVRRWAYLNLPKIYKQSEDDFVEDSLREASKYFDSGITITYNKLLPYWKLYLYMIEAKLSEKEKKDLWRQYLLDEPYLIEEFEESLKIKD